VVTGGKVISSPAVVGGVVYIGSGDGTVRALAARDGRALWSVTTGAAVSSSPVVTNGVVYIGSDDGHLYALDARSGTQVWSYITGAAVEARPTVVGAIVYVGSDDGSLYALSATTGARLWSYATGNWLLSSPVVAGTDVYVGSLDHNIYALDARTGLKVWSYDTGSAVWSTPAVIRGTLYVGSLDGKVYALDARTGGELWATGTSGPVYSSPVLVERPRPTAPVASGALGTGARYFAQTGHTMSGAFLTFYTRYGGLATFGYPRTEPFMENGHLVQYTERFALNMIGGRVATAPLGRTLSADSSYPAAPAFTSTATKLYFSATGHGISGPFLDYWKAHNGAVLLGAPISQVVKETNGDGTHRKYRLQWFERGRLEYHPELSGTRYSVLLGLVGKQDLIQRGWLP